MTTKKYCTTKVTIKSVEAADFEKVSILEEQNSKRPYSKAILEDIFAQDLIKIKAQLGEAVVGYAVAQVVFNDAEIINIVVDKKHQNRGIGRRLLRFAIDKCQENNATRILLEVEETNLAAITLYKSFGFMQISTRENYYEKNVALIMEYILNN